MAKLVSDRLLSRIIKVESGCWEWDGAVGGDGYGRMQIGYAEDDTSRSERVHRIAYCAYHGPIKDKKVVMHKCHNKLCVNPDHLRLGSVAENNQHSSRLNTEVVKCVRYLHGNGVSISRLAKAHNCADSTIWNIVSFRTWKDVELAV